MNFLNGAIYSINAAAIILGAAGLLSRLLGVLRDRLLASHFGASRELDIYYAAFQIPDFMFTVFLLGAASAAIIPVFIGVKERGEQEAREFIGRLLSSFFLVSVLAAVAAFLFSPFLISLIAPGFGEDEAAAAVLLTRIMLLSPIFLGLSGIVSSVLQSFRRFFVFAATSVFYNLGIIFGILVFLPRFGLVGLAFGVVLGAALHFLTQLPLFFRLGFGILWAPAWNRDRPAFSDIVSVFKLSWPRVAAISAANLTIIALVALTSFLEEGSITVFQLASNLHYLPIGIFGASFAAAAFPSLAEAAVGRRAEEFLKIIYGTARSVLFWILPLAVFFYVLRAQIVRVALGAGFFDWTDTRLTAALLGILTLAVISESLSPLLIKSFYALGNTRRPLFLNVGAAVFTVAAAFVFMDILSARRGWLASNLSEILRISDISDVAVLGAALAFSLGSFLNAVLMAAGLKREIFLKFGGVEAEWDYGGAVKMFLAALASGVVAFWTLRFMNLFVGLETFWGVFFQGAAAFGAGAFFYASSLYLWGNREMMNLLDTVERKMINMRVLPQELD